MQWVFLSRIRKHITLKLTIALSAIIILLSTIFGLISYSVNNSILKEEIGKQLVITNELIMSQIGNKARSVITVSNLISMDTRIEQSFARNKADNYDTSFEKSIEIKKLDEIIGKINLDIPQIRGLFLCDLQGNNYYKGNLYLNAPELSKKDFNSITTDLEGSNGEVKWKEINTKMPGTENSNQNFIFATKYLNSLSSNGAYGIMIIAFDERFFSEIFKGISIDQDEEFYLLDQYDRLLYTRVPNPSQQKINLIKGIENNVLLEDDSKKYLLIKNLFDSPKFKLIRQISLSKIEYKNQLILRSTLLIGLMGAVLMGAIASWTSNRMLLPLKMLVIAMKKVRLGELNTKIALKSEDEFSYISESFNSMTSSISSLINDVYKSKITEKEAQLKALQAQLNPHFLYNSLNAIYWKIILQYDDEETAGLVSALSGILQYSLEPIDKPSSLREELDQIREYLKIQSVRNDDTVKVEIIVNEDILDYQMMRFAIQPLVENVFVHAFCVQNRDKELIIHAFRLDSTLIIEITDNGLGMDTEKVFSLLDESRPALDHTNRENIGVKSVSKRIKLIYGPPYTLEIQSSLGVGTTMRLILPLEKTITV